MKRDLNRSLVQVLMETDATDTITAEYTYGNDLISRHTSATSYYHYDGLGSARQLSDSSETITDTYTYEAFGKVVASSGSSNNAYKFTGEQFDVTPQLLYLRARYYDSEIGRFISRDAIGIAGGINLYTYCRNNPVSWIDPTGLITELPYIPTITWYLVKHTTETQTFRRPDTVEPSGLTCSKATEGRTKRYCYSLGGPFFNEVIRATGSIVYPFSIVRTVVLEKYEKFRVKVMKCVCDHCDRCNWKSVSSSIKNFILETTTSKYYYKGYLDADPNAPTPLI